MYCLLLGVQSDWISWGWATKAHCHWWTSNTAQTVPSPWTPFYPRVSLHVFISCQTWTVDFWKNRNSCQGRGSTWNVVVNVERQIGCDLLSFYLLDSVDLCPKKMTQYKLAVFFKETTSLHLDFLKSVTKGFMWMLIDILCASWCKLSNAQWTKPCMTYIQFIECLQAYNDVLCHTVLGQS